LKNSKLEPNLSKTAEKEPADRNIAVAAHRIESRDLFIGTREITISHGEDIYRLRLTAQNKLILTK
jgi:hemin uptake protein HemP